MFVRICYNNVMLSSRAVINYMEKRPEYNEVDIKRIKTRLENETRKNRPQKYDWLEDENLPQGKYFTSKCFNYFHLTSFYRMEI